MARMPQGGNRGREGVRFLPRDAAQIADEVSWSALFRLAQQNGEGTPLPGHSAEPQSTLDVTRKRAIIWYEQLAGNEPMKELIRRISVFSVFSIVY
jgi:hypothetical protein